MLPKKQRIPKALVGNLFLRGKSLPSPHFLFKFEKIESGHELVSSDSRFVVSISKKVAPTAVLRNRTRRRVYSALHKLVPNVRSGYLIGFSVKKGGEQISYEAIVPEIKNLLSKAGLLV